MYAIIQDGGHQYRVENGQRLRVQVRPAEPGSTITFDQVRLVGGDGAARVGRPFVEGASVQAKVTRPALRGRKLVVSTFKRRKNVHRKIGHRQNYTEIEITAISG